MTLKTPLYNLHNYPNVYEPSEDTFLLLDALELDIENILEKKPNFIVEIGSGNGVIITALATYIKSVKCFATDLNFEACKATNHTTKLNNVLIEICNMHLLSCFKEHMFDIVVFNPPYVVTDSDEIVGNGIARAWAGGINGREVIDDFLKQLPQMLSSKGICYMVIIKENNLEDIKSIIKKIGLHINILKERKVPSEHLYVLKIYR